MFKERCFIDNGVLSKHIDLWPPPYTHTGKRTALLFSIETSKMFCLNKKLFFYILLSSNMTNDLFVQQSSLFGVTSISNVAAV